MSCKLTRSITLLISSLVLWGCGESRPPVYPASGRMLYEGKPMPLGASVTFLPLSGTGVATSGMVDSEGNLTISTFEGQPGLVAGEYRVIVYQTIEKEPDQADADGEIRSKPTDDFISVQKEQRIPKVYSDRDNSPLKVTIKEEDNDLGTLELKADAT
jgi:hypothetical protein